MKKKWVIKDYNSNLRKLKELLRIPLINLIILIHVYRFLFVKSKKLIFVLFPVRFRKRCSISHLSFYFCLNILKKKLFKKQTAALYRFVKSSDARIVRWSVITQRCVHFFCQQVPADRDINLTSFEMSLTLHKFDVTWAAFLKIK